MDVADNHHRIAATFVDARLLARRVDVYPGEFPQDLNAAYEIQDRAIALHPHEIGGWKVGRIPTHLVAEYGANRLAGPIFANRIVMAPQNQQVAMPILPGFAAVEAELMLRIGATPPPVLDLASAANFVDQICFGIEVASSPYSEINLHGPTVTVSDFGNNFGLVLGPPMVDWRQMDLMSPTVKLAINDQLIGTSSLAQMLDGPFGSVVFLNELLHRRGMPLQAGQWISTGAITGVHEIAVGQSARATFGDSQVASCIITSFIADEK